MSLKTSCAFFNTMNDELICSFVVLREVRPDKQIDESRQLFVDGIIAQNSGFFEYRVAIKH